MNTLKNREFTTLKSLLKGLPKSSRQLNALFTADCEILKLSRNSFLTTSTDSIGEEIDLKLYQDPYLWGWMTVMSSASDLAASGAQPLGLLLSNQWKYGTSHKVQKRFFLGVKDALSINQIPLLGGDSGSGQSHCHTSTILGMSSVKPLSRLGIRPGDVICLLGKRQTGYGPSIALKRIFGKSEKSFSENHFRPTPSVEKVHGLRHLISASIDTSDGIAVSLQILSQLNRVGFNVLWNEVSLSPVALGFCRKNRIHPLMLWMNDLGDLQTLVAIPKRNLVKALTIEPSLLPLATTTKLSGRITLKVNEKEYPFPIDKISNCPRELSAIRRVNKQLNKWFFEKIKL